MDIAKSDEILQTARERIFLGRIYALGGLTSDEIEVLRYNESPEVFARLTREREAVVQPRFKDGDAVTHITGGPLMTVEDIRTDDLVSVVWFTAGELHRDAFKADRLQKWVRV